MAKRGILEHPKTLELACLLDIEPPFAVGLLECLWQWAADHRPTGDLTGIKPAMLCLAIRTRVNPATLWEALLSCGWLDQLADGRVIIHDWSEHANDTVHRYLQRRRELFADGVAPFSRARRGHSEDVSDQCPDNVRSTSGQRRASDASLTRPPVPLPKPIPMPEPEPNPEPECSNGDRAAASDTGDPPAPAPVRARIPADAEQRWQEFLSVYPARNGDLCRAKGREKFRSLLKAGVPVEAILDGARRYRQWADAAGKSGTEYVQQLPTWLNRRSWEEPWTLPARASPKVRGKPPLTLAEEAEQLAEATVAFLAAGGESYA